MYLKLLFPALYNTDYIKADKIHINVSIKHLLYGKIFVLILAAQSYSIFLTLNCKYIEYGKFHGLPKENKYLYFKIFYWKLKNG